MTTVEAHVKEECDLYRKEIRLVEKRIRSLMEHHTFNGSEAFTGQHGEMKAQIMLAVRHLEDARMRIGKILQYARDGVSILDT